MKTININIDQQNYKVEQAFASINIYKISHQTGSFEITRNRYSGKWKVLIQSNKMLSLPLTSIGRAIEENLGYIN